MARLLLCTATIVALTATANAQAHIVLYDSGGIVFEYVARWKDIAAKGGEVEVLGYCGLSLHTSRRLHSAGEALFRWRRFSQFPPSASSRWTSIPANNPMGDQSISKRYPELDHGSSYRFRRHLAGADAGPKFPDITGEGALEDGLQEVQRLIDPLVLFPGGFAWEVHVRHKRALNEPSTFYEAVGATAGLDTCISPTPTLQVATLGFSDDSGGLFIELRRILRITAWL